MKKRFLILTIAAVAAISPLQSCKKLLETEPTDFISPDEFFSSKENLKAALTGAYSSLKNNALYGDNYQHLITATTDELVYATSGNVPKIPWYNATAADAQVASVWSTLYTGIDRANVVLVHLNTPAKIEESEKRHIEGEARFLRAYYYFMLTQWYGDVPLRLKPTLSPGETNMAFTPSKAVYDWVIDEMTAAEGLLNDQKATAFDYTERVTQTAVQAVLARVCLYAAGEPVNDTRRYADAAKWAREVVNSGLHKLNPDYTQIFKMQCKDQYDAAYKESIWEVGFNVNTGTPEQSSPGQVRVGIPTSSDAAGKNDGRLFVYPRLYRTYESFAFTTAANAPSDASPDQRRDWCVAPFKYSGGDATTPPAQNAVAYNLYYTRYPGKWRRSEENEPRVATQSPTNYPIVRYADVLLMLAEAENELNGFPTPEAIGLVNQVRGRAYGNLTGRKIITGIEVTSPGAGYTTAPAVTITGEGGTGATALAIVSGGSITGIRVTNPGKGYPANTTVTIAGGGASARVILNGDGALSAEQTAGKEAFLKAIQDERLMELNGEFLRKQDLKRWGILQTTIKQMGIEVIAGSSDLKPDGTPVVPAAKTPFAPSNVTVTHYTNPANNISDKDYTLAIPQKELLYNDQAKQNPGY
ncbi:RagB/SusD family nutrient uptake outer membrane protein [Chitinophaga sp. GCM10012297]|uniref:RagB/SusD family nutrient uptake outer membrane protein n=1 Tax=Chitinophaga chungangae TaxID=2821488 RepID=A0ABS3YK69_9BACT|nr:RagB/SusD family nutrient uptake outer membrane protein [Chitinophaga chungangae]MBO9154703.1 RagB/SusD family nutrient uptake outer membrane protein [Chitinophaga chungangae]